MKRKQFPVRWPFDTNTLKECNGYLASIAFGNDPLSQIDHKQGERKKAISDFGCLGGEK